MAAEENKEQSQVKSPPKAPKKIEEKELLSWTAASRPFKTRDREFYITIISMASIFALIMFIIEGVMPVLLIISAVFLFYVMSTVEPDKIKYEITNLGVKMADRPTSYLDMTRFWFSKRFDTPLLIIETVSFPGRLEMVINSEDQERIKNTLEDYIVFEKAAPSSLDKAANWVGDKLPLKD